MEKRPDRWWEQKPTSEWTKEDLQEWMKILRAKIDEGKVVMEQLKKQMEEKNLIH